MPNTDKTHDDTAYELEQEKEPDRDREREKGPKTKGPSKSAFYFVLVTSLSLTTSTAKDLSHVPCKFFKVGSCTAGSSCPFSHSIPEPGQQKDVCTWFVKGNCKFGHKCALAHILPGQSMAMDRKNKKAAQAAASSTNTSGNHTRENLKAAKSQKAALQNGLGSNVTRSNSQGRTSLLQGSTAPTRMLQGSTRASIPMSLKASISPSVPAPPLKDTDFASFGLPDESNKLPSAPAQGKPSMKPDHREPQSLPPSPTAVVQRIHDNVHDVSSSPSLAPVSTPSISHLAHTASLDFGPIGSPPRSISSPRQHALLTGLSPGTSPAQKPTPTFLSSSPFSAPGGTQSLYLASDRRESSIDPNPHSGLAVSLGSTRPVLSNAGVSSLSSVPRFEEAILDNEVVEDEDLEDLIPSSLTDLLTPEERSRRYSRTNATTTSPGLPFGREGSIVGNRTSLETPHHRHSRSVPAPTLLGDIRSIWADNGPGLLGSPRNILDHGLAYASGGLNGTPSSLKSTSAFGGRALVDDHSSTFLSPSNASAAFLPNIHHHHLNAKTASQRHAASGFRPGTYTPSNTGTSSANAANLLARLNDPSHTHQSSSRQHLDGLGAQSSQIGRPIPVEVEFGDEDEHRHALSPSTRALQAHAPGQSLPQGLAAGYSRIHALPPPPVIPSPSTSSNLALSQPGTSFQGNTSGPLVDWIGMSPTSSNLIDHARNGPQSKTAGGLDTIPSRMAYTGVTSRSSSMQAVGSGITMSLGPTTRIPSGKNWASGITPLSPLSGPVLTGDDDDLFSMDG